MEIGLKDKQLTYLKQVYKVRVSFLWPPFFAFGCLMFIVLLYQIYNFQSNMKGFGLPSLLYAEASILFYVVLPTVVLLIAFVIYTITRIIPLEKDILHRSGEQVDFRITRKAYFHNTNECYFFFKEHEIPNIQIDHATFLLHDVGSFFYIYRSYHSKIVFENYLRFDLV